MALRIASWNVNSILARLPRLSAWLREERPAVVCLQETKVQDHLFPVQATAELGYRALFRGEKSYNGVAILVRDDLPAPECIASPLGELFYDGKPIDESRFLLARIGKLQVASVYVPNGRSLEAPHAAYKLAFLARLAELAQRSLAARELLLLAGDFNVAPREEDVCDVAHWAEGVLFHPTMRAALQQLIDCGLVDLLPKHHPEAGLYSWWDYRHLAFAKDKGLRIDLLLASEHLAACSKDAGIDRHMRKGERPSDHVPVWTDLANLTL